jgi:hypothetical protein
MPRVSRCWRAILAWASVWWSEVRAWRREERGRVFVGKTVKRARSQSEHHLIFDPRGSSGGTPGSCGAWRMAVMAMGRIMSSVMAASAAQFPGIGRRCDSPSRGQPSGPRRRKAAAIRGKVEKSGACTARESGGLEVCTSRACFVLKEAPHMHVGSVGSASDSISQVSLSLGSRADTIDCHDSGEKAERAGGKPRSERGENVDSRGNSEGGAWA